MLRISTLILAASSALAFVAAEPRVVNQNVDRALSRVVIFDPAFDTTKSSVVTSELFVEYGAPIWKGEYDAAIGGFKAGTRLRLGKDAWTTLESWSDLAFGETKLGAGRYCLLLEKGDGDSWSLVAFDAHDMFARRMEANWPMELKGGTSIPLTYERVEDTAAKLEIKLIPAPDVAKSKAVTLELHFGPHKATARLRTLTP